MKKVPFWRIAKWVSELSRDLASNPNFLRDDVGNNNTCIKALAEAYDFNPLHRRLRCAGHIINLVAKQVIWLQQRSQGFKFE